VPRRLSRFLHLERRRGPAADPDPDPASGPGGRGGRFDAVERPKAGPGPRVATGARLERFEQPPPPEPALELLEVGTGARPFTRCMGCGTDHHLLATACTTCGASLATPAQHAFNERLWAERQAESARERAAGEAHRAAQEAASAEEAQARRAYAEALAREVGDAERRRLGVGFERRPLGATLLALLPAAWRTRAAVLSAAAVLGLLVGGLAARSALAVVLGLLLLILIAVPRGGAGGTP
jgi:hypothetical protein